MRASDGLNESAALPIAKVGPIAPVPRRSTNSPSEPGVELPMGVLLPVAAKSLPAASIEGPAGAQMPEPRPGVANEVCCVGSAAEMPTTHPW